MKRSSLSQIGALIIAVYAFALPRVAVCQMETAKHNFNDTSVAGDGTQPMGALILGADGAYYGTSYGGGTQSKGTIFKVTPSGSVTILHSFGDPTVTDDGANPTSGLVQGLDGNFYGTTENGGGSPNKGIVFVISPQGAFNILHRFGSGVSNDGANPMSSLTLAADGTFYGTTKAGGSAGFGTIYQISATGTYGILHHFGDNTVAADGRQPQFNLLQAGDGSFYGTTPGGGSMGKGTVYKLSPQNILTILHSFEDGAVANDGTSPSSGLTQGTDGNLYGLTSGGGAANLGTAFNITPQGIETVLHNFGDGTVLNDGSGPMGALTQGSDGNLYGTTKLGGAAGAGSAFELSPLGSITLLHSFGDGSVANDGTSPANGLIQGASGNFYGTTQSGGTAAVGTFFMIAPAYSGLTIPSLANANVGVLFRLQVTGSNTPTRYAAANLPDGLSIDPDTGVISGTPTTMGTAASTVTLINAAGSSTFPLSFTVGAQPPPAPSGITIDPFTEGQTSSVSFTPAGNRPSFVSGGGGIFWVLTGILPPYLSFNSLTGTITGFPTVSGTFPVTVTPYTNGLPGTPIFVLLQIGANFSIANQYYVAHDFNTGSSSGDGTAAQSILQGFDGNLYGPTLTGGAFGAGSIFTMTVQGAESLFYSFKSSTGITGPQSLLQASDGNFYGTTQAGQVFKLTQLGQLTVLHAFGTNIVLSPMIQAADGNFYGTTQNGGSSHAGSIFSLSPQGIYKVLHNFGDQSVANDGATPYGLIQGKDGNFYGTTKAGGSAGKGTVFKLSGSVVTILHHFGDGHVTGDGAAPMAAVIQGADGNFYGTTSSGGSGSGTIFQVTPQANVTILHTFAGAPSDGASPEAPLLQGFDGSFYGTTTLGGAATTSAGEAANDGILFQLTSSLSYTIAHNFGLGSSSEPTNPTTPLIQTSAGNFYGTTPSGITAGPDGSGGTATTPDGSGRIYSIAPVQSPINAPIFIGSNAPRAAIFEPFRYTPRALFSTSGAQPTTVGPVNGVVASAQPQRVVKAATPTSWSIEGNLPANLGFDPSSGTISGTPVVGGIYNVALTATNDAGPSIPQLVTIEIDVPPGVSSPVTDRAEVGSLFSYPIQTTPPPVSYLASGLLPWLSEDPDSGTISGTPPAPGTYLFRAGVHNLAGDVIQPVLLTVTGGSPLVPMVVGSTTVNGTVGTPFKYHVATANAATAFSAVSVPAGFVFDTKSGTVSGLPNATGLITLSFTATNSAGSYAAVLTFDVLSASTLSVPSSLSMTAATGAAVHYPVPATGIVTSYAAYGLPDGLSIDSFTGLISGNTSATGKFNVSILASNSTETVSSVLSLVIGTPVNFSTWASTQQVSAVPAATPLGDGVPNYLKYLYDINPTRPMTPADRAALPTVGYITNSGGQQMLTLTYRLNAFAISPSVNVETSSDLKVWGAPTNYTLIQTGTDSDNGDPIMQAQVLVTNARQFVRLDVTPP